MEQLWLFNRCHYPDSMSIPVNVQAVPADVPQPTAGAGRFVWLTGALAFCVVVSLMLYQITPVFYFARVPLTALAIFAALLPFLATNNLKSLLIGAYDLTSCWAAIAVGFLIVLCGMSIYMTATLDMQLGGLRVEASEEVVTPVLWQRLIGAAVWAGILINAVVACWASGCFDAPDHSGKDRRPKRAGIIIGLMGGLAAGLLIWGGLQLVVFYLHKTTGPAKEVPKDVSGLYMGLASARDWLRGHLPPDTLRGYISRGPGQYPVELDHLGAACGLGVTAIFYRLCRRVHLVPLGYVLLLLAVLTWALSGLSFFLELYRVPLLAPIGFCLFFAAFHPKTDHYYKIVPSSRNGFEPPTPADVLGRAADRDEPVILVAAAGGGIQAAVWTAEVLTGLEEQFGSGCKCSFSRAVKLLSGVSGGSVGSMFFAAAYPKDGSEHQGPIRKEWLERVREAASASSLSGATQGFAYNDLVRAVAPFLVRKIFDDRGRGLERAWMRNVGCHKHRSKSDGRGNEPFGRLDKVHLREWQEDAAKGIRPAIIFNATVVETGQRLAFSTVPCDDLRPPHNGAPVGALEFLNTYRDVDILISTAARLSSTFTYVSPAARPLEADALRGDAKPTSSQDLQAKHPLRDSERWHLVDGGYHEGSGLGGLMAWLADGLGKLEDSNKSRPKKILIITISAFPSDPAQVAESQNPGQQGAVFQFEAPFLTFANMQGSVHSATAWREFVLLKKLWESKSEPTKLEIVSFRVPPGNVRPPLSWHLRASDKRAIKESWTAVKVNNQNDLKTVADVLGLTKS